MIEELPIPVPEEDELQAYVEDKLSAERRNAVVRYLRANPDEALRIATYREQRAGLAALLEAQPAAPVRPEVALLGAALTRKLRRHRRVRQSARVAVAACVLFATASLGWLGREQYDERRAAFASSVAQQAAQGYRMYAGDDGFAYQSASGGAIDPFGWLAQRAMGQNSMSPDLTQFGFELVNGWVFPTQLGNAVQLLYRDQAGQVVTLYAVYGEALPQRSFSYAREGDLSLLFWQDGNVSYCLAGQFERPRLAAIAESIAAQAKPGTLPSVPAQSPAPAEQPGAAPESAPSGAVPAKAEGPSPDPLAPAREKATPDADAAKPPAKDSRQGGSQPLKVIRAIQG